MWLPANSSARSTVVTEPSSSGQAATPGRSPIEQALEKDIRTGIEHWNEQPKPFTWTKTADEILDRLTSYLQWIPGAGP
jgi:hypothetical protein